MSIRRQVRITLRRGERLMSQQRLDVVHRDAIHHQAAERHQAHVAQLIAAGQRPRTVGEILAVAALYP